MAKGKGSRSHTYDTIDDWLKAQPRQERRGLRDSLTKLQRLYRNKPKGDFTWWHDVGALVAELAPKGGRYGKNVMELLAQRLEPDRKPAAPLYFLCKARDFAAKFNPEEASDLTEARLANGKPLSENHVKALLSVEDDTQRQRFLDKCLKGSWSVRYLRERIQDAKGRKRSGPGRPLVPKRQSAGVAISNIILMSRNWLRNHEVWFEEPGCFSGRIRKRDREAILEDAQSAVTNLKKMQEAIKDGLKQLNSFIQELKEQ